MVIAQDLAEMLRDARTVISDRQDLINDPQLGDKHLTGKIVLDEAVAKYTENTGADPKKLDPASRRGRLLRAMMAAIVEVVEENQPTINEQGTGFKGFIPAVFGRLVAESFVRLAKGEAEIKVTAPLDLVRNRKARPDPWEDRGHRETAARSGVAKRPTLFRRSRNQRAAGIPRHGSRILCGILPCLSWFAEGQDGRHRLP
jgi:hypothetical protein